MTIPANATVRHMLDELGNRLLDELGNLLVDNWHVVPRSTRVLELKKSRRFLKAAAK